MSFNDESEARLASLIQRFQRHRLAVALYTDEGDPLLANALDQLGKALQLDALEGPPGAKALAPISLDATPRAALAALWRPWFRPGDLRPQKHELAQILALLEARGAAASTPDQSHPIGDPHADAPSAWLLEVWLTNVVCRRETNPRGKDEFFVGGRWKYDTPIGHQNEDRHVKGYGRDFRDTDADPSDNRDDTTDDEDFQLLHVRIPPGKSLLNVALSPWEEDGMSAGAARAIAYAASTLTTVGVDAAIAALSSSSVPGVVTKQARDIVKNHALPGLVGLIASALGPDPFNQIEIVATTNRNDAAAPYVAWEATVKSQRKTHAGEGTLEYAKVGIQEQRVEEDASGVKRLRYIGGGGRYDLDFEVRVLPVTGV